MKSGNRFSPGKKQIILLLFLIHFYQVMHAQIIRGIVFDKSDLSRIDFASIYINGTSTGTHSDKDGHFELDISKFSSLPLKISALGYFTETLTSIPDAKPLEIFLSRKMYELSEVVVAAKSTEKERKANLRQFRDQFLGAGYNGQNCVILNEGDIAFKLSGDTLKAFASKPILIVNNALGYKITYYLDRFEYSWKNKSFLYKGSAFFDEDMSAALTQKNFFEKRRRRSYLGSRNHFFSSLWTNSLNINGFVIKSSVNQDINYGDIVIERAGFKKYLSCHGNINIYYLSKTPNSNLLPSGDQVYFEKNGYFDGSGLKFTGKMAEERIGDLLPYDYKYK